MNKQCSHRVSYQLFENCDLPFQAHDKKMVINLEEGEVLVKVLLATICGSDLHTISGARKEDVPCILGHEAVGEVVEINQRAGFAIGDRVTWSIADSCGQCKACTQHDLPEKCDHLFKYGHASVHKGSGLNGCYSSHVILRRGTHLVKIPDQVSNELAAPANCALATMVNVISKIDQIPKKVVVQGGGLLGIYGCALLKEMGVPEVYCFEVNQERFGLIEDFGACPVDAKDQQNVNDFITRQVGQVDVVIEVAGKKELVSQGLKLIRPGGTYVLAGLVHPDSALDLTGEQIIRKCLKIVGVHNYSPQHLDEAIGFLTRNLNRFPFHKLVSSPYPLSSLQEAVGQARRQKYMRVSVQP